MFSNYRKQFLSTNITEHLINDIKTLGPYSFEARWIVNMIDDEKTADEKDGHSSSSYRYTKDIATVIKTDSYIKWKNNYVHLSFDDMLRLFYFTNYYRLGNKLITTSFDESLIREFNKIHKLNNYKIKEADVELKPFMVEITNKFPELK